MGFKYWIVSDWAAHMNTKSSERGCDMQMYESNYYGEPLKESILNGTIKESVLDEMVTRILRSMFTFGLFDTKHTGSIDAIVTNEEHKKLAQTISE